MAKQVTVEIFGIEGTGATPAKAKLDAMAKIEGVLSALKGDWEPCLLVAKQWGVAISRSVEFGHPKWCYSVFQLAAGRKNLSGSNFFETKDLAISNGAFQLAQLELSYAGLTNYLSPAELRDLDRYFVWQAGYAAAKAQGLQDRECRIQADQALDACSLGRCQSKIEIVPPPARPQVVVFASEGVVRAIAITDFPGAVVREVTGAVVDYDDRYQDEVPIEIDQFERLHLGRVRAEFDKVAKYIF